MCRHPGELGRGHCLASRLRQRRRWRRSNNPPGDGGTPDPTTPGRQEPRASRTLTRRKRGRGHKFGRLIGVYVLRVGLVWPVLGGRRALSDLGPSVRVRRRRRWGRCSLSRGVRFGDGEDSHHQRYSGDEGGMTDQPAIISLTG